MNRFFNRGSKWLAKAGTIFRQTTGPDWNAVELIELAIIAATVYRQHEAIKPERASLRKSRN